MKRQKSFVEERPSLYLVATPIGNIGEFSNRAIETLKMVDVIACEDTRNSGQLLKRFNIETKLISYHLFNEKESSDGIIELLKEGKNVAVISDAGYPLISDPGQLLVNKAIDNNIPIVVINGPSAFINALVGSGLKIQPFTFYGFLSSKENERRKELNKLKLHEETLVFYEAPHRIEKMLKDMLDIFGNRKICIARELTKIHEEYLRGTIEEVIQELEGIKGEIVVVCEGYENLEQPMLSAEDLLGIVNRYVEQGMTTSEAIKETAKQYGLSKNEVYRKYFN